MNSKNTDSSVSILLVVLSASEQELTTARTYIAGAEQIECVFTLCDENTSTTVEKVLRENNCDMVCFTAAEGGAAMEQALRLSKIAKERGALSVVATTCGSWSAAEYLSEYSMGRAYILAHTDSLLLIPEEQLCGKGFYSQVSDFVSSTKGLLDDKGFINLDFPDVSYVLKDSGVVFFARGTIKGCCFEERAHHLKEDRLLPESVLSATNRCLFWVCGCMDIGLEDVEAVATQVQEQLSPDALMIFGAWFDDCLVNEMQISILVAGFDV